MAGTKKNDARWVFAHMALHHCAVSLRLDVVPRQPPLRLGQLGDLAVASWGLYPVTPVYRILHYLVSFRDYVLDVFNRETMDLQEG